MTHQSWLHRFIVWLLICCASAAPSFVWAVQVDYSSDEQLIAMALGILMFIVGYTIITGLEPIVMMRRRRRVRAALTTGYTTRIAITLAFPVGMYIDLWFGMIAVSLVEEIPRLDADGFTGTLLTTLVQGTILNIALFLYMLIVLGFLMLFMQADAPEGFCWRCRYDLRGADHAACPECGTELPRAHVGRS